ncbi:MAG: hypothetical protein JSV83_13090 [Desulfobacterales bacterium]|nr:MAG: hypothetical protein JSV83_13090 [Desulfobacterales bacterium]
MGSVIHAFGMRCLIFFIATGLCCCAPSNLLRVHYQLPPRSDELAGNQIFLSFKDAREKKTMLSESAREALSDFSGNFTLVVGQDAGGEKLLGAYDLDSLLKEAFKQRIEHTGIQVSEKMQLETQIEFVLKQFMLDLQDRKWILTMSYQTNLLKDGNVIISETISGSAERLKMSARRDAEKIIGELISDTINKVNLSELFREAGL